MIRKPKIGDFVVAYGVKMTIVDFEENTVTAAWHDADGEVREHIFPDGLNLEPFED